MTDKLRKAIPAWMRDDDRALAHIKRYFNTDSYVRETPWDPESSGEEIDEQALWDDVSEYVSFAQYAAYENEPIELYRALELEVKHGKLLLNVGCLGKAWSRYRSGAGVYGIVPHERGKKETAKIVIAAMVTPKDVDWEYGLQSFLYYGQDQWEISVKQNKKVLLVEVDGRRLEPSVRANTGPATESWVNEKRCVAGPYLEWPR